MNPEKLLYTKEHEWLLIEADTVTVGITDYAQDELGDIVFAELPDTGSIIKAGDSPVTLESVKAVSSVYTPFDGEIIEVNSRLADEPEIINTSPFDEGWIYKIKASSIPSGGLLSFSEYEDYLKELE